MNVMSLRTDAAWKTVLIAEIEEDDAMHDRVHVSETPRLPNAQVASLST